MVDAAAFHWQISANLLETLASEQLAGTGHVLDVNEAIVVQRAALPIRCASYSQPGVLGKLAQEVSEVVRVIERYVRI